MLAVACPFCLLLIDRFKKIGLKQIIVAICAVAFVVYLVYAVLIFRHAGTIDTFISSFSFSDFNKKVLSAILTGEGELGLRNIFYYFIDFNNQFTGFGVGATYLRVLLFWLPGSLSLGIKPDDFALTIASAYMGNPSNTAYSVHPTFFGDAYANFGFMGFLVGILWGAIFNVLDTYVGKKSDHLRPYLISTLAFSFVIIGRGSVYNGAVIAVISFSLLIFSNWLLDRFFQNNKVSKKIDRWL